MEITPDLRSLFSVLSMVFMLGISLPLMGAVVRMRANYAPKKSAAIQLPVDAEGNENQAPARTPNFFAMLGRIKRIEGWAGFYKGLMPSLTQFLMSFLALASLGALVVAYFGRTTSGGLDMIGLAVVSIASLLVTLPGNIIINRAIITPYRLRSFRPIDSARILLSAAECKNVFLLYLTPGFLFAEFLALAIRIALVVMRNFLIPAHQPLGSLDPLKLGVTVGVQVMSTLVLCPLDVVSTKLSVQRNREGGTWGATGVVEGEAYNLNEDVIAYRGREREPYGGLVDCVKRIVNEEGWRALYRVWWLTLLLNFPPILSVFFARES